MQLKMKPKFEYNKNKSKFACIDDQFKNTIRPVTRKAFLIQTGIDQLNAIESKLGYSSHHRIAPGKMSNDKDVSYFKAIYKDKPVYGFIRRGTFFVFFVMARYQTLEFCPFSFQFKYI